uniref:Uncharacterized protein n=1 Tax=Anopheles atroparvus TaxID=41427 RepID=A0A182IWL6_ANOAO
MKKVREGIRRPAIGRLGKPLRNTSSEQASPDRVSFRAITTNKPTPPSNQGYLQADGSEGWFYSPFAIGLSQQHPSTQAANKKKKKMRRKRKERQTRTPAKKDTEWSEPDKRGSYTTGVRDCSVTLAYVVVIVMFILKCINLLLAHLVLSFGALAGVARGCVRPATAAALRRYRNGTHPRDGHGTSIMAQQCLQTHADGDLCEAPRGLSPATTEMSNGRSKDAPPPATSPTPSSGPR